MDFEQDDEFDIDKVKAAYGEEDEGEEDDDEEEEGYEPDMM